MALSKKRVRVLLADDQTLFREGIKDLLENERHIEIVGEAAVRQRRPNEVRVVPAHLWRSRPVRFFWRSTVNNAAFSSAETP